MTTGPDARRIRRGARSPTPSRKSVLRVVAQPGKGTRLDGDGQVGPGVAWPLLQGRLMHDSGVRVGPRSRRWAAG